MVRKKQWSQSLRLFALISVMLFFTTPAAYAINLNGYKLIPSLTVSQSYDDNYFLVNKDFQSEEQIWITTVTPDIRLEVGEVNKFALGFRSDLYVVEEISEENRQNQTYTASIDLKSGERGSLKIEDTLVDARDQGATRPAVEGEVERTIRVQNDLRATMGYKLTEKLGSKIVILWSAYDFDVINMQLTRHEYHATLRGTYLVRPNTNAFIGYRYSNFTFTGEKFILAKEALAGRTANELDMDNQGHTVQAGLEFLQLPVGAGKLQGELWAGYERIDFEVQDDQDAFVLEGRLTYLPSARTNVVLIANREHAASALVSGTNSINSSVRMDIIYRFYEKLQATLGLGFRTSEYQEPEEIRGAVRDERTDDVLTFKAGVRYSFYKYFSAGLAYDFTDKSVDPAELRNREYQQNRVTFTLNGTF